MLVSPPFGVLSLESGFDNMLACPPFGLEPLKRGLNNLQQTRYVCFSVSINPKSSICWWIRLQPVVFA